MCVLCEETFLMTEKIMYSYQWSGIYIAFVLLSDGTYYGMVMSVRPSVRVSVRQSQFSALFSYMLWHIELKFCMSLSSYEHSIKFECHQFPSILVGVMPLLKLKKWKYTVFRSFLLHALTYWAEILHMTLLYCTSDQVRMWSICVNFCWSYAPFGT